MLVFTVVVFLGLAFAIFLFMDSMNQRLSESTGLVVSIDSFPNYLETHPLIESLPGNALMEVVIGSRIYGVDGKSVYLTDEMVDKDISIYLPEGYESKMGELGLCKAIKEANKNGDLKVEFYASKLNLLLKYHKFLKYGECLGAE